MIVKFASSACFDCRLPQISPMLYVLQSFVRLFGLYFAQKPPAKHLAMDPAALCEPT
jgi:hypothetical protein